MADNGEIISAINSAVGQLRADVKLDISQVRVDVKQEIATVHSRMSDLSRATGEFEKKAIDQLARIEQFEKDCPIDDVVIDVNALKRESEKSKGSRQFRAWIIGTAIALAGVAIAGASILART